MRTSTIVAGNGKSQAAKIRSFAQLPDGWHYGEGCAATGEAMGVAVEVDALFLMYGADAVEVFPDVDGGILVSGYRESESLEVLCGPSGRLTIVHEVEDEVVADRGDVSIDDAAAYIGEIGWTPENLSEYSIPSTTARAKADSRVSLSSHQPAEESRFLTPTVPARWVPTRANTLRGFIAGSREIPVYSGDSTQIFSRDVANLVVNPQTAATRVIVTSTASPTVRVAA